MGPIQPEAVDGHMYAIGFVDSLSRYQKCCFLRPRDEAIEKVEQFFTDIGQPGTLVCDGAREYVSNDIKQLSRQKGVRIEFSAPHWGTVTPKARYLLEQSGLEKEYWPYALNMASEIKNFSFHSGIQKTLFGASYKQKHNSESIKVFVVRLSFMLKQKIFEVRLIELLKKECSWGLQTIVQLSW